MEKLSLYDLLAVLFPGVIGLCLLDAVRNLFGLWPAFQLTNQWELIIILGVVMGGLIYRFSFSLTQKWKWFYHVAGLYRSVSELYLASGIHPVVGEVLNHKAQEYYGMDIFLSVEEYSQLTDTRKMKINQKQDEFYDRMYYRLEYENKLATPKAFQSFYLFFRNVFLAALLACGLLLLGYLLCFVPICHIALPPHHSFLLFFIAIIILQFAALSIARWYRQRMVMKMYWYFFIHLENIKP